MPLQFPPKHMSNKDCRCVLINLIIWSRYLPQISKIWYRNLDSPKLFALKLTGGDVTVHLFSLFGNLGEKIMTGGDALRARLEVFIAREDEIVTSGSLFCENKC